MSSPSRSRRVSSFSATARRGCDGSYMRSPPLPTWGGSLSSRLHEVSRRITVSVQPPNLPNPHLENRFHFLRSQRGELRIPLSGGSVSISVVAFAENGF